jgi:MerR family transcriptional regulator, thiopeptide resistance regulator
VHGEPVTDEDEYTVGAAAELIGVSVRALHHYDRIGLAGPSKRSAAGYRLYTAADLALLQRVVFYRELGLDLADIGELLANPDTTDADHLRRQRELLEQRIARSREMLAVIDKELAARAMGIALTPRERMTVFGGDRLVEHADDARRQWGDTPEFTQRQERTARYTEQDWLRLRTELHAINQGLAAAMADGVPATDPAVLDLAERLREHTHRWFHDCDHAAHAVLAEHYRDNRRSGRNYDEMVPGLSQYVHDAIVANGRRAGVSRW